MSAAVARRQRVTIAMPIARHGAGTPHYAAPAPWRDSINPLRPLQVGSGPVFAPGLRACADTGRPFQQEASCYAALDGAGGQRRATYHSARPPLTTHRTQ